MFNPNFTNVIIINGSGGCGKSTFCEMCRTIAVNSSWEDPPDIYLPVVVEASTIDYVKAMAKTMGWNGEKDEKGRALLSALKDALENYDHIPSRKTMETIERARIDFKHLKYLFFVNIREPENISFFKAMCINKGIDCHTLLIESNRVPPITSNHADKNVADYQYDYYIKNNGDKNDLYEQANRFMYYTLGYGPAQYVKKHGE